MTVETLALAFLIMRLTSLIFVGLVLRRQIMLFKLHIESDLIRFRMVMFLLGLVLLLGSIYPIYFDAVFAFNLPVDDTTLLVSRYALSNVLSFLAGSVLLYAVYRIAGIDLDERQEKEDDIL